MKFLIDNALSPKVSLALKEAGHDSVHVRDYGLQSASDIQVFELATQEERILISADTDFSTLLSIRNSNRPSVILFRAGTQHKPDKQVMLLLNNLKALQNHLERGSVITIEPTRIRVRRLPLGASDTEAI